MFKLAGLEALEIATLAAGTPTARHPAGGLAGASGAVAPSVPSEVGSQGRPEAAPHVRAEAWPQTLAATRLLAAFRLPSGRVLCCHRMDRSPNDARPPFIQFAEVWLALWRDAQCEAVLSGMEKIGYFGYMNHQIERDLVDVAELADGGFAAHVWGERDSDGLFTLEHNTYLWDPHRPAHPEQVYRTGWHREAGELWLYAIEQVGGPVADATRTPYAPERVIRRLPLAG